MTADADAMARITAMDWYFLSSIRFFLESNTRSRARYRNEVKTSTPVKYITLPKDSADCPSGALASKNWAAQNMRTMHMEIMNAWEMRWSSLLART